MSDIRDKVDALVKHHNEAVEKARNEAYQEIQDMMIDWKADNSNRVEQCRGVSEMINLVGAKIG